MDDTAKTDVATGIAGLDNILAGGFTPNRIYLIEGDPGAGKTTLSLQYLLEGLRAGEKGMYVSLSETKEELDGVAQSHGWNLDGIQLRELDFLDVGELLDPPGVVPVVIKSLLFSAGLAPP